MLTKKEACRELGMSLSTLDRRITAGRLMVRRERHGQRHRVYVMVEDDIFETHGINNTPAAAGSGNTQLALARERIRVLEEQVEHLEEQLRWERKRNVELFKELKNGGLDLSVKKGGRVWWQFWSKRRKEVGIANEAIPWYCSCAVTISSDPMLKDQNRR